MRTTFSVTITLNEDAMQTFGDIAEALKRVADKVYVGVECGTVRDLKNEPVGFWRIERENA